MPPPVKYGKVLRSYGGSGVLTFNDSQSFTCSMEVFQLTDGRIMADCQFTENLGSLLLHIQKNSIESIAGMVGNEKLVLGGEILWTNVTHHLNGSASTTSMLVLAQDMTVRNQSQAAPRQVHFGLTNFEFIGNSWKERPGGGGSLRVLSIKLPEREIEIQQLPENEETTKSIRAQGGVDVTCEALIDLSPSVDLQKAAELVATVCTLLSFARGTKINWLYYEVYDQDNTRLEAYHKANVAWQYGRWPVIDPRNPNETASFVDGAYKAFRDKGKAYRLDVAIDSLLDAKRETTYLETRALAGVVVMELLKSRYAVLKNDEYIVGKQYFKNVRHAIDGLLEADFNKLAGGADEEKVSKIKLNLSDMKSNVALLRRRPFRTLLRSMFIDIGLDVSDEELVTFVKIRNSLVHKASFTDSAIRQHNQVYEYAFVLGMVDRAILKILAYTGYILDGKAGFTRAKV